MLKEIKRGSGGEPAYTIWRKRESVITTFTKMVLNCAFWMFKRFEDGVFGKKADR